MLPDVLAYFPGTQSMYSISYHPEKKSALFSKGEKITLNISNIKWSYSGGEYRVEFMQEYSSGNVEDKGTKILTLSGCPSFFKIKSEIWRGI